MTQAMPEVIRHSRAIWWDHGAIYGQTKVWPIWVQNSILRYPVIIEHVFHCPWLQNVGPPSRVNPGAIHYSVEHGLPVIPIVKLSQSRSRRLVLKSEGIAGLMQGGQPTAWVVPVLNYVVQCHIHLIGYMSWVVGGHNVQVAIGSYWYICINQPCLVLSYCLPYHILSCKKG